MSDAEKIKKITEILIDYELVRISPAMHIERIKEVIIEDSDDGK